MIKNINEQYGDPIDFENIEEMAAAIKKCGYSLPEDGLKEGRDYVVVKTILGRDVLDTSRCIHMHKQPRKGLQDTRQVLCGYGAPHTVKQTDDPEKVTCPKCLDAL